MDETLIHAQFFQESYADLEKAGLGFVPPAEEGDCAQFNLVLGQAPGVEDQFIRLNVKVRQHMEEVLQYLSSLYEICVFTAGEQDYAD